jgi:predicted nucleic acid-binding protein
VVDASVAAKWLLPEQGETLFREARHLLNDFGRGRVGLIVPDLFWPEIGNVLWKAAARGRITAKTALDAITWCREIGIPVYPSADVMHDALGIALAFKITAYDAVYISLAVLLNQPLITADERLVSEVGSRLPVRWLGGL